MGCKGHMAWFLGMAEVVEVSVFGKRVLTDGC